jgi:WD40 repeat protein
VLWGVCAHRSCRMDPEMRVSWQLCTLTGHSDAVLSVAFSPDGKRVVSGSHDSDLKIWNVPMPSELEVSSFVGVS